MGDANEWQQLFNHVKDMMEITECMTKDTVITSKAFEIAKDYLYDYIKNHPKNKISFCGILAGWDKQKGFQTYEVSLYELFSVHGQMPKYDCITLGSGGAYARAVLDRQKTNVHSDGCKCGIGSSTIRRLLC
ncbi:hypothetical protein M0R45_001480 [Rubus argutus]|uniref:Uncharacterized protein n=1 Tax=Rubus argutus TaxID=59490 RepID=A0AAW1VH79_RUBAR